MYTEWVRVSSLLPHEDQQVEFVVDGRSVAMDGTYAQRTFRSHWSGYRAERVRNWRSVDPESPIARSAAQAELGGIRNDPQCGNDLARMERSGDADYVM